MKIIIITLILLIPLKIKAYETSATSAILYEMNTGQIIYKENENLIRPIASISKIMTAIIAIEKGNLSDIVIIENQIDTAYGSSIYLEKGEEITLESLIYGLMLRSGNDAALAIANNISQNTEQFVQLMNEKAKEIGMKNTIFNNPHGLDQNGGNLSTAYDMAILTSYAMKNETYKKITSTEEYKFETNIKHHHFDNKHKLLYQENYITGGKTGYTDQAKRTLVTTASKNNINLVAVTLNDGNDFVDHINLFEEAFEKLKVIEILKKGELNIPNENFYKDSQLYINNNLNYVIDNDNYEVTLEYKLEQNKDYNNGDIVGMINVIINDKIIKIENIYIENKEKNFFQKIIDWIF